MRAYSSTTVVEQPAASNRRQPVRQTRNNPSRTASNVIPSQGGASAPPADNERSEDPGFFPALTHYTDAISALPKEMIRHNTMLKEVDAKIYGPEAQLVELINTAMKTPIPSFPKPSMPQPSEITTQGPATSSTTESVPNEAESRRDASPHSGVDPDPSHPSYQRRLQFHNIRTKLYHMIATLDEKNHVINTAIDCLEKQTKRCNSSFPHIEDEISEEARLGSMTHWAYTDKAAEKKGIMAGERTRRAANTAAALHEAEAAIRSESRREAIAAKRPRNQHHDSDFDDGKLVGRKVQNAGKGRKVADTSLNNGVGLGIVNGASVPNKRRKIEKPGAGNLGAERAMSSVYGSNSGPARGNAGSPRDLLPNDANGKKKSRAMPPTNGTGRKRTGTNASAVNSPALASSPMAGTFAAAKDRRGRSPAPSSLQRMPSSRARQNSTQHTIQASRNGSLSASSKAPNGNGMHNTTADVEKVSNLTGRTTGDVKSTMKETVNSKGEHLIEDLGAGDGAGDLRGGIVVGSRAPDRATKREESFNGNSRTRPPSISVSTRGNGGNSKQPSKNPTPIRTSFSDASQGHRSRPQRREVPAKRSHKKGAGLAAQMIAAATAAGKGGNHDRSGDHEPSSLQADDDDDDDEEDGDDEPRYCYCNGVSYGEMVGCDGKECQREWFHLDCVGLEKAPGKNVKWYCDECKGNLKDKKFNGSAR